MSSQNVTDKIIADAKGEAQQILKQMEEEASKIADDYAKRAAHKKAQNDQEIKDKIKTEIMRALSQKRLDLNKHTTEHKQNLIKTVIKESISELIGHKDYLNFLKALIKRSNEKDGDLMLSGADAERYRSELEKYIKDEGLNIKITVDDGLTGGVVIEKEKTSYIGSLDIITELLSDELAIIVSKELFQIQSKG